VPSHSSFHFLPQAVVWVYGSRLFSAGLWLKVMVFNLGYKNTSYIIQNETQEPLEPWTSSDPRTHQDLSPNWDAGMPETSSIISLAGHKHISNW
jgi:hypothetical protein